ncbi:hypothetical protein MMC31_003147, partial [Peltigera leucophlebia]|nr:hypothetical protein [Peltigera leucophlebia]
MLEDKLEFGVVVDLITAGLYWIWIAVSPFSLSSPLTYLLFNEWLNQLPQADAVHQSFLGVISKTIYNVYFHPLSHFPGPPLGVATPIPYAYRVLNGGLVGWIQLLHEKYGEVVRIHPNELSFVEPSAWRDIFLTRPLLPRPQLELPGGLANAPDMNMTPNQEDHQRMRKVFSTGFSERVLQSQEPLVQKHSDLLIQKLQDLARDAEKGSQEVDILEWYSFASFDIIGDLLFGESFHALETSEHHPWVKTLFLYVKVGVRLAAFEHFGPILSVINWCMPNSLVKKAAAYMEFTRDRVDKRIAQGETRPDLMSAILQNRDQIGLTQEELYSNAALLVFAGSQTTAVTCGSVTWFLLKNPSAMKKLQEEIRGSFRFVEDITFASTAKLPYLRAVIQEALRLHPPSPLNVPRDVNRPGVVVCGHEIPIGTRVCIPQKVANRLPQNFVKPFSFLPERWLEKANPEFAADRKNVYEPFHVGAHSCLGR